jgi:hypothetical protein
MSKKITGIILIILGSIPLIMRVFPLLGIGPDGGIHSGRMGMPNGNFPSGGMPPSGSIPSMPAGGPPGGGVIFGTLGTLNNPYVLIIGVVFIVVGIILLTHKEKRDKALSK